MIRAGDVMNRQVISIPSGSSLRTATALLLAHGINALPVLADTGRVVGVVGIRDVLRTPLSSHDARPVLRWDSVAEKAASLATTTVDQVMTRRRIVSVEEDAPIMDVAGIMANQGVHPILVLRGGDLVGVIGRADVARVLIEMSDPDRAADPLVTAPRGLEDVVTG